MWSIYRKWMIIAILSGCVYVFGYADPTMQEVVAAPCIEECESNLNYCNDVCAYPSCGEDSTEQDCYSCLQSCSQTYFQCLSYAVSCQWLDVDPARCTVDYALHCPVIAGDPRLRPSRHRITPILCGAPNLMVKRNVSPVQITNTVPVGLGDSYHPVSVHSNNV